MNNYLKEIRFICVSFLTALVVIVAVISFNIKNDYANVFVSKDIYDQIAWQLNRDKYIIGPQHFSDRYLKLALIKTRPLPDIGIMGSSRILNLHADSFKNRNFINLWIGSAMLRDYIAFLGAFDFYKGAFPKTIILTIEPWLFNHNQDEGGSSEWLTVKFYHDYMMSNVLKGKSLTCLDRIKKKMGESKLLKWRELINPQVTSYNFKSWKNAKVSWDLEEYKILDAPLEQWEVKQPAVFDPFKPQDVSNVLVYPDGSSVIFPETFGLNDQEIAQMERGRILTGEMFSMKDFSFDQSLMDDFTAVIEFIRKKGVKVYFFIPPYYPMTYAYMVGSSAYRLALETTEKHVRDFASQQGISVVGSYDPHALGLVATDFVDHIHYKRNATKKLFALFSHVISVLRI